MFIKKPLIPEKIHYDISKNPILDGFLRIDDSGPYGQPKHSWRTPVARRQRMRKPIDRSTFGAEGHGNLRERIREKK